jgi:CO/xanthine dehydrogenase FAD-binding subunit
MQFHRPESADAALRWFAKCPDALPLAGGTDLMVAWNAGALNDRTVLDLSAIRTWNAIRVTRSGVVIGALVDMTSIQAHRTVRAQYPLLVQACATLGGVQIQNRATLAGNVANASPAGDSFPPLAVYEVQVQVASSRGRRVVAFDAIFAGVKKTTLQPGELITGIALPRLPRPQRQVFRKVGTRAAQAISKTVAAGLLWLERDGRVRELRFALGSMAPTVRRLRHVEDAVRGRKLTARNIDTACALLEQDVAPIDDLRSTREYRLETSRNLLRAFLAG